MYLRPSGKLTEEIKSNDYVLIPGKYVGVEKTEDDGIPFEEKMKNITSDLSKQFEESHRLEEEIKKFLLGVFGYFSYPFLISLNISGFMMLLGKKPSKSSRVTIFRLAFFLFIVLCLFTTINNLKSPSTLGEYLKNAYASGRLEISKVVAGGALFSLFTYLPVKYLTPFQNSTGEYLERSWVNPCQ